MQANTLTHRATAPFKIKFPLQHTTYIYIYIYTYIFYLYIFSFRITSKIVWELSRIETSLPFAKVHISIKRFEFFETIRHLPCLYEDVQRKSNRKAQLSWICNQNRKSTDKGSKTPHCSKVNSWSNVKPYYQRSDADLRNIAIPKFMQPENFPNLDTFHIFSKGIKACIHKRQTLNISPIFYFKSQLPDNP